MPIEKSSKWKNTSDKKAKDKRKVQAQKRRELSLRFRKIRELSRRRKIIIVCLTIFFIAFSIFSYIYVLKDLPSPKTLIGDSFPVSTQIYDRNGILLYEIYSDKNRTPVKLTDIPDYVINATIAIEDKDFYKHFGFDLSGISRAFYKTVFKQEKQGGSTITQQLVKTALLSPERTLQRKIKELWLSIATEIIYSKDEILELYLNHVPYGGTAYGIEQAAKLYFNKHAKDLTLAEAAMLAGLPQAPTKYSPFGATPDLARSRQIQVLKRMVDNGLLNHEISEQAQQERLNFARQETNIKAPHFVMYVKDLLVQKYGEKIVEQGGLRVTTTLDYKLQEYAQASVSAQIKDLKYGNVSNGAALVTSPPTGEILAMIGSKDYFDSEIDGNVNLTTSLRQPGSSIKPLNYALGLEKGYTAATMFLDIPTCFVAAGQPSAYCPKNYDGGFHGVQQMRPSLANSYNIPAVKMLAMNGIKDFIATASAMGISTWTDSSNYGLSLTLGGGEVKMVDMAVAFGVFANSGIRIDLNPILKLENYQGEILEDYDYENSQPVGKRILTPETTFIISDILADNRARTPAFGAYSQLVIPGKTVSVKTGTTDDLKDNWTIGYTPEYLVATWVGNNDSSKMNGYIVSGVTGAAPIWNDIMSYILKDKPDVLPTKPETIIGTNVCQYKQNPNDPNQICEGRFEYFAKGTETNMLHGVIEKKNTWIDKTTGKPPEFNQPAEGLQLELQEKTMASDELSKEYCVDCPHENEKPRTINIDEYYLRKEMEKLNRKQNTNTLNPPL